MDRLQTWIRAVTGDERRRVQRLGVVILVVTLLLGYAPQQLVAQNLMPQDGDIVGSFVPSAQPVPWVVEDLDSSDIGASVDGVHSEASVSAAHLSPGRHSLIIDSDFGVDDTVAVASLISLVQGIADMDDHWEIQGLVTSAGVTTVKNATYNARLLLCQFGLSDHDIPVIRGAETPTNPERPSTSFNKLIHGPDGLWWLAQMSRLGLVHDTCEPHESLSASYSSEDATHFYCEHAELSGATLLVLGPLTNVANAMKECKKSFRQAEDLELVILGGADMTGVETPPAGNESPIIGRRTPVTEFNSWQDPEAARYVFNVAKPKHPGDDPRLNITLIPQNTFVQYSISPQEIGALATSSNAIGRWLTVPNYIGEDYEDKPGPLPYYVGTQTQNGVAPTVPDLVAAAYAVDQSVRSSAILTPSVVSVFGGSGKSGELVAGHSLIAQSVFGPKIDPETGQFVGFGWLGTGEQIAQVFGAEELSNVADAVFASGNPFDTNQAPLMAFVLGATMRPENNAQVVAQINPDTISEFLMKTLTSDFVPVTRSSLKPTGEVQPGVTEFDERIFLPLVGVE